MRIWARGGVAILVATSAGLLCGLLLNVVVPVPVEKPKPGPVLESVTPAQLAAMGVRLDPTLQPVQLPDWLTRLGVRLPTGIQLASDAESVVRRSSGGVRSVSERALSFATVSNRNGRVRGPTIVRRLVWALVGTRAAAGSVGGLVEVLWLVDAHMGHQLAELTVLGPAPAGLGAGAGGP